jgi:hypothetical protein
MMDFLPGLFLQGGSVKIIFYDKLIVLRVVGEKSKQRYFSLARQGHHFEIIAYYT